jgi:hypothetical protein
MPLECGNQVSVPIDARLAVRRSPSPRQTRPPCSESAAAQNAFQAPQAKSRARPRSHIQWPHRAHCLAQRLASRETLSLPIRGAPAASSNLFDKTFSPMLFRSLWVAASAATLANPNKEGFSPWLRRSAQNQARTFHSPRKEHSPRAFPLTSLPLDSVRCTACCSNILQRLSSSDHETPNAKSETSAAFQSRSDAPLRP